MMSIDWWWWFVAGEKDMRREVNRRVVVGSSQKLMLCSLVMVGEFAFGVIGGGYMGRDWDDVIVLLEKTRAVDKDEGGLVVIICAMMSSEGWLTRGCERIFVAAGDLEMRCGSWRD